jgi:predicted  nucleic acid-binding Zn-ribbon protein
MRVFLWAKGQRLKGDPMILNKSDPKAAAFREEVEEIRQELAEFKQEIQRHRKSLRDGKLGPSSEALKLMSELRRLLQSVRETEREIANIQKEQAGYDGDYAIHLEQAHAEICCRLARLRKACCSG